MPKDNKANDEEMVLSWSQKACAISPQGFRLNNA